MLIMLLSLALAQSPPAAVPCAYDHEAMMAQSTRDFDQTPSGWRSVAQTPGCETQAADLIKAYRRANWAAHKPAEIHTSYWHEGQMRAAAGQDQAAIPLLMAGSTPTRSTARRSMPRGRSPSSTATGAASKTLAPASPPCPCRRTGVRCRRRRPPETSRWRGRRTSTFSTNCWPVSTGPTGKPIATADRRRRRPRAPSRSPRPSSWRRRTASWCCRGRRARSRRRRSPPPCRA